MSTVKDDKVEPKPAGKGNRKGGYNQKQKYGAFKKPIIKQPKFEGKCEELKGHVYDCTDSRQADAYTRTTKEIWEYVAANYKQGADASYIVQHLVLPTIVDPADPVDPTNKTQVRKWEKRVNEIVKREIAMEENVAKL